MVAGLRVLVREATLKQRRYGGCGELRAGFALPERPKASVATWVLLLPIVVIRFLTGDVMISDTFLGGN
jgi:hypothetical protein